MLRAQHPTVAGGAAPWFVAGGAVSLLELAAGRDRTAGIIADMISCPDRDTPGPPEGGARRVGQPGRAAVYCGCRPSPPLL